MTAPSAEEIAARLKAGAWQFELHMSMSRQHLLQSRSVVDPRVQLTRVTPKRGEGQVRVAFHFEDCGVDVGSGGRGAILLGTHEFATLEALAAAIARHDRELAVERAWAAAEPARSPPTDRSAAMQTAVTTVRLADLRIDEVANVRKTGRGSEPPFVASIRAKGIIEPLTVRPNGAGYKVVNGGKRLASLAWMAEHGEHAAGMNAIASLFADHRDRLRRPSEPILRSAEIDGDCRFALSRTWGTGPTIVIAGCNPSTADGQRDDPTMCREMAFANRWGFGALVKINVFPVVETTTSMGALRAWRAGYSATWDRNLDRAAELLADAGAAWAAWGALVPEEDLGDWIAGIARRLGRPVDWQCLGVTASGAPKHTLARGRHRIPDDARLVPWKGWG